MVPQDIIIGDVLRVLEGDLLVADPPLPGTTETKLQRCIRTLVYDRLNERIAAVVDRKTLASVVNEGDSTRSYMYFI
jgi:DNA-binding IscR family transcriptional regulator